MPLFKSLKNWLLPSACVLCDDRTQSNLDLCNACEKELPWLDQICPRCALPLAKNSLPDQICGACIKHPPPFHHTIAIFAYHSPIDRFITQLKFNKNLIYARLLGELFSQHFLAKYIDHNLPEKIIPVPLHPKRLRERGFNQAIEIARPIAKKLKIPLDIKSCQRIRATQAQSELQASERAHNVKNAFAINTKFKAKHVAIFDDVVTTGHTVIELSKVLREQGIDKIDVWCCARTSPKSC